MTGEAAERLAWLFLRTEGYRVVARNVEVDGGELDLIVNRAGRVTAVEVRSRMAPDDPIEAVDDAKLDRVHRLATQVAADGVGVVGVQFAPAGVTIIWLPVA